MDSRAPAVRLALCATLFATAPALAQPNPAPFPEPALGDITKSRTIDLWNKKELRTTQSELVEIQADRLVTRVTTSANPAPQTNYYTRQWEPCRSLRGDDKAVCAGALKFPMRVGDKYGFEKLPWPNGEGHSSGACEVLGQEAITIPAGTFDTFKVECSGYWNRVYGGTFSGREKSTFWYAPKIGWLVRSEYRNFNSSGKLDTQEMSELVEFSRK